MARGPMELSWSTLRGLTIWVPVVFLVALELVVISLHPSILSHQATLLFTIDIGLIGAWLFSRFVFALIARMQREILQRNRHLTATTQILGAFAQTWDLGQALPVALGHILKAVEVEFGVVCFSDEAHHELVAVASQGIPHELATLMARRKLGDGLEAQVVRSGRLEVIEDAAADPRVMEGLKMLGVRSMILLPLTSKGSVKGLAFIGSSRWQRFSHLELQFLQAMGSQIALAAENAWLFAETRQQSERLRVLNELGIDLASELSLDALLQKVVNFSRDLVEARFGALSVLGSDGSIDRFLTSGLDPEEVARIGPPPKRVGLLGLLLKDGRPLRLPDLSTHRSSVGFPPHHPPMKSFLGAPIVSKGKAIGSLYLTDKVGGPEFTQADQDVVAILAAQAAVAIENARLYEQLQGLTRLQERERIAMDLHDGVIQSIYAVGLNLEGCIDLMGRSLPEVKYQLVKVVDHLSEVIKEIRNYIFDLRPDGSLPRSVKEVLEDAVKELRVNALIDAQLIAEEIAAEPTHEQRLQLSYIVREAVANIIKHARASGVSIQLSARDDHLYLSVKDNGVGFAPAEVQESPGQGLRNMRQRARKLGGQFLIASAPGGGTTIIVTLPARARQQATDDA